MGREEIGPSSCKAKYGRLAVTVQFRILSSGDRVVPPIGRERAGAFLCSASAALRLVQALPETRRTNSAPFSAIMIVAALVFAEVTAGITEASITRKRSTPRPLSSVSTTERASPPMRQVLVGWNTVPPRVRANSRRSVSPGRATSPRSTGRGTLVGGKSP